MLLMSTIVTIRHCNCLKASTARVRDMLVAEGFDVKLKTTLRPLTLQVEVHGKTVWSYALWRRRVPDQKALATMVQTALQGVGQV